MCEWKEHSLWRRLISREGERCQMRFRDFHFIANYPQLHLDSFSTCVLHAAAILSLRFQQWVCCYFSNGSSSNLSFDLVLSVFALFYSHLLSSTMSLLSFVHPCFLLNYPNLSPFAPFASINHIRVQFFFGPLQHLFHPLSVPVLLLSHFSSSASWFDSIARLPIADCTRSISLSLADSWVLLLLLLLLLLISAVCR